MLAYALLGSMCKLLYVKLYITFGELLKTWKFRSVDGEFGPIRWGFLCRAYPYMVALGSVARDYIVLVQRRHQIYVYILWVYLRPLRRV